MQKEWFTNAEDGRRETDQGIKKEFKLINAMKSYLLKIYS